MKREKINKIRLVLEDFLPPATIEKIENFGKTFDQLTKETVKAFLVDSKKSKFKI